MNTQPFPSPLLTLLASALAAHTFGLPFMLTYDRLVDR